MALRLPDSFKRGDRVVAVAGDPLHATGQAGTVLRKLARHCGFEIEWDTQPYPFSPKVGRAHASSLRYEGWTNDNQKEESR